MEVDQENMSVLESKGKSKLKILIVEDDFASFKILEEYLCEYGDCSVAVNGAETIETFKKALDEGQPYDLICLDIMLPEMSGHLALEEICQIERKYGITNPDGVKVIMTTAVDDPEDIIKAFKEGCKAYIVKPITREKLLTEMRKLDLIESIEQMEM
ncbi:MAG: response regulator [Planctomycetota bacterium]|jgi:two-component system chemotaxis response regulator CheY